MGAEFVCNVCEPPALAEAELAVVRPNIRKLKEERFAVWRCKRCGSIHAKDEVDLDRYYRDYPFFAVAMDWRLRAMYRVLLRRLTRAGVRKSSRILDYGCGSGKFVQFLKEQGYEQAGGYDAYSEKFRDPSILERKYDCVVSQDVIEHVAEPWELLRTFAGLVEPGGIIAIGTPDAAAIDLDRADDYIHALHQPFHRHILSTNALLGAGRKLGWKLERYYPTMYINTLVPFINSRFVFHYLHCFDNTIDLFFEPVHLNSPKLWSLQTFFYGFFGYFLAPKTDVMAVFQTPSAPALAAS
jgi:SAM-dependent methyltransferase